MTCFVTLEPCLFCQTAQRVLQGLFRTKELSSLFYSVLFSSCSCGEWLHAALGTLSDVALPLRGGTTSDTYPPLIFSKPEVTSQKVSPAAIRRQLPSMSQTHPRRQFPTCQSRNAPSRQTSMPTTVPPPDHLQQELNLSFVKESPLPNGLLP